jgi:hypothetical protein
MYPDRWRRRPLTAEGLLDLNMPRASTAASDKFSAKYGQSVGVVIDRRLKLKRWARTWMSHHQIPRLDGDQAERCDGNLPFASRLMALLSMTSHWVGQAFVEGEIRFSGVAQTVGFGLGRSKMLDLSMGID